MIVLQQTEVGKPTVSECHSSYGTNDVPARELVLARLLHRPGTLLGMQLLFQGFRSDAEVHVVFRCLQDEVATEWK